MEKNLYLNFLDECSKRENLQNLFDVSFQKNDKTNLRKNYIELRELELNADFNQPFEAVDISSFTENITMACDILTSDIGVNFLYCGNETNSVMTNSKLFTKALLNLLSNAYLYGKDRLVLVKTTQQGEFIKVEVQSGGSFLFERENKGLYFVKSFCKAFGGRFLIESDILYSKAIMIFSATGEKGKECEDFWSLISNRLSPVYIEFFGMQYN